MTLLPGVSGTLFPSHFLASGLPSTRTKHGTSADPEVWRRHFAGWWRQVESSCGPATGLRALFDLVAMPLAGLLGFRARDAIFEPDGIRARLCGPGVEEVELLLLPWASRPSRRWRDLAADEPASSRWLIVAPPFVSLVAARGHAVRRSVDFRLPDAIGARSFNAFWTVCRAETLSTAAVAQLVAEGERFQDAVREDLQLGVAQALSALGPAVSAGTPDARLSEALTLVYRILFLLFAESRSLAPTHHPRFGPAYTVAALCRDAAVATNTPVGLWDGLAAITRLSRAGCDSGDFTVRPFNGRLFARSAAPALEDTRTSRPTRVSKRRDAALARALISLATRAGRGGREAITYADLGVEQLGAVYERVLDLDPDEVLAADGGAARPSSLRAHSRRRKETGTFYTPQSLAEFVVRRTLAPLVRGASTDDILSLRIVDPAMGSGAFLVAACRFLADAYERALVEEGRCAETDLDADSRAGVRRLIASRCLAGVDLNPVAVQVARLSLWLVTLARDKPLSFFDHQLRVGDSLVGASPDDLLRAGGAGRSAPALAPLFEAAGLDAALRGVAQPWRRLREGDDDTIEHVRRRERLWVELAGERSPIAPWRAACDLWCARWFWSPGGKAPADPELRAALDAVLGRDISLTTTHVRHWLATAREIGRRRHFFHWPLEFADLFYEADGAPRGGAGFHAVIGNPPWEMLRGREHPDGHHLVEFVRGSGLYKACDRGHLNLYQPFLERSLSLTRPGGRVGLVLPWSLAVDDGAASLRRRLLQHDRVDTLLGLDNSAGLFPIHRGLRFLVLTAAPNAGPRRVHAKFGVRTTEEIDALPHEPDTTNASAFPLRLDAETIRLVGGPALRIPDARSPGDLEWLVHASRRHPALGSDAGWDVRFGRELNATEDRGTFGADGLLVIDGKHVTPFRVDLESTSRRVRRSDALRLLPAARFRAARLAYRDVSGVGNRFTLIAAIVPPDVVTTHTLFCLRTPLPIEQQAFLCGLFNSSTLNRIVRMLMGSHVTTSLVENLPIPLWDGGAEQRRVSELARELGATPAPEPTRAVALRQEIDDRVARMYG